MDSVVSLEDVILALPSNHRLAVVELRSQNSDLQRKTFELESELTFMKQKVVELENQIASASAPQASVPAPVATLQDLIAQLKQQHINQVDSIRRKTTDSIQHLDDPAFDAYLTLQGSIQRSLKPPPKQFEFVDLLQLKETVSAESHMPRSPIQIPLIHEFLQQIDGVRQCTKDGRFVHMYYDPLKSDLLRKMFDACRSIESMIGTTNHLQLPPVTVSIDPTELKGETDLTTYRLKETNAHVSALDACGGVFERGSKEMHELDEMFHTTQTLPHFFPEFEAVLQDMAQNQENLTRNEAVIAEGGQSQIDTVLSHRLHLSEANDTWNLQINEKTREYEQCFEEMARLLQKTEDIFSSQFSLIEHQCRNQTELALCDLRIGELRKAVVSETQKQQRFQEGTKFTSFLCTKSKDLFRRLYNNLEESMRTRRELDERTRVGAQEQLYNMAENLHSILTKRSQADTVQLRSEQQHLENANRALMGYVHMPAEMERQMEVIRQHTVNIANIKSNYATTQSNINDLKQILMKYNTLQFLRRDVNFLSSYDNMEKTQKLKEKVDDCVQRIKFISEMLVEVSDPDTRQEYVVEQCMETLKLTLTDVNELVPLRVRIEDLDEQYRVQCAAKIKRHRRLIAHYMQEFQDGTSDLCKVEPTLENNITALVGGIDQLIAAVTRNEEPVPQGVRQQYQTQAVQQMMSNNSPAVPPAVKTFGGGRSVSATQPTEAMPMFHEAEAQEEEQHTFARVSNRLKVSMESRRLAKPPSGMEMSNTSAVGAIGFRAGTGIHAYTVRIGQNCTRLLVGFADWNLPLDGYCNSLKYPGCYYLHVGNGTLWCPEQGVERKPYTYESIGASVGGLLKCIINTNEGTIGFVWGDINLGIAFRNVSLARTIYPAFELFSNNCTLEFVNYSGETQTSPQISPRR